MHNLFIEQLSNGSNPSMLCSVWYIYVLTLSQTLATLLELILASRGKLDVISVRGSCSVCDKAHSVRSIQPIQKGSLPTVVFDLGGDCGDSENTVHTTDH